MFACCCNQCHTAPPDADEYENVTKVDDYGTDEPDPAGILPYARPWNEVSDLSNCIRADVPPETCGVPGKPVCYDHGFDNVALSGDPLREAITGIKPCATSDVVTQVADNCYSKTGNKVSFKEPCKRKGWKGVQALAVWPGRFGFVNSGAACCNTGGLETSKYSKVTHAEEIYWHHTKHTEDYEHSATFHDEEKYDVNFVQAAEVNANGNETRTGHKHSSYSLVQNGVTIIADEDNCAGSYATGSPTSPGIQPFGNFPDEEVSPPDATTVVIPTLPASPSDLGAECGKFTANGFGDDAPADLDAAGMNALYADVFNTGGGSFTATHDFGDGVRRNSVVCTVGPLDTTGYSLADNEISLKYSGTVEVLTYDYAADGTLKALITDTWNWQYHVVITLTGAIIWASVMDDCIGLLGQWPLNNDAIYPWRTDGKTWLQPYVTRDAAATEPTIAWGVDEYCNFANEPTYTGAIKGGPLPAGYSRHFNFRHKVWDKTNDGQGRCNGCEIYLGELSADPLPPSATVWPDRVEGAAMYGAGAHVSQLLNLTYGSSSGGGAPIHGVLMQKWAETLEEWPSVNFARACGRDRYLRDETKVACIESFASPDLVLKEASPQVEFEVGNFVGLPGGIYRIGTKTDALHYAMNASFTDLPASITYDGVAKLRFVYARGICGILPVAAEQVVDGVKIIVLEDHWMRAGDVVDFKNVDGLGSGVSVTAVLDSKTFIVPGTLGEDYAGAGYVVSKDITADTWNWHSTCSRHEFLLREWRSKHREAFEDPLTAPYTFGESSHTLAPIATEPSVLVISPNASDTFPNMYQQSWANNRISPDLCHGQEWHMDFLQAVVDPFWQPDHEPCGHCPPHDPEDPLPPDPCIWEQAAVPCGEDADHFQYPPLVEPRITKPVGAPDIPVTLYYRDIQYDGGPPPMPSNVGTPICSQVNMEIPKDTAVIHSIRAAWEACDDWKIRVNFKCPAPPVSV